MENDSEYEQIRKAAELIQRAAIVVPDELPEASERLFRHSQEHWNLNAYLSYPADFRERAYRIGYLSSAKMLARIGIATTHQVDTLIYPIAFLYRHYIELQLKKLIRTGAEFRGEELSRKERSALGRHDLEELWHQLDPYFREIVGDELGFDDVRNGMKSFIDQIDEVDKSSTAFRYDQDKRTKEPSIGRLEGFNLLVFCRNVEKLCSLLEGIECQFEQALDAANDYRAELRHSE